MLSEQNSNNQVGDFDLFEITYSLWKNKFTLISTLIISIIIAFLISIFEKKNNSVFIEIGPNTAENVFLYQLEEFDIDTTEIFRNFMANIKTRKIIERTLRSQYPTWSSEIINEQTTIILSQLDVKIAKNELASEFRETAGFKFYRIEYTSSGDIEVNKKFIRALIDENNKYFINIYNNAMDSKIDYKNKVFMTELKAKSKLLTNRIKNQNNNNVNQQSYIIESNKLITEKYATQKKQSNVNKFSIDLTELEKNLEIAKTLDIKKPTFTTPANIQSDINSYSFFLGTETLKQKIKNIKDSVTVNQPNETNIRAKVDKEEIRLLKKSQDISLQQRILEDKNVNEMTMQELRLLNEKIKLSFEYMNPEFRDLTVIRDAIKEFMASDNFMLIEETSSIGSVSEKNLLKYLIIFITLGFLLSSAWIFFNEARLKRNISL